MQRARCQTPRSKVSIRCHWQLSYRQQLDYINVPVTTRCVQLRPFVITYNSNIGALFEQQLDYVDVSLLDFDGCGIGGRGCTDGLIQAEIQQQVQRKQPVASQNYKTSSSNSNNRQNLSPKPLSHCQYTPLIDNNDGICSDTFNQEPKIITFASKNPDQKKRYMYHTEYSSPQFFFFSFSYTL